MNNLKKTRIVAIRDKFLAVESWARRGRYLPEEEEKKLLRVGIEIGKIYNELWNMLNTSEKKGQEWGWWE